MVERWPPLLPVPLVWPPTKVWKWKYGEKGHDTGTAAPAKCSNGVKYRLGLSSIAQFFRPFWAAAAKCATVILLQHSLIKAFIDINKRWQPDWERERG